MPRTAGRQGVGVVPRRFPGRRVPSRAPDAPDAPEKGRRVRVSCKAAGENEGEEGGRRDGGETGAVGSAMKSHSAL